MANYLKKQKAEEDSIEYSADNYLKENSADSINDIEGRLKKLRSEIDAIRINWENYNNKYYGGFNNG